MSFTHTTLKQAIQDWTENSETNFVKQPRCVHQERRGARVKAYRPGTISVKMLTPPFKTACST